MIATGFCFCEPCLTQHTHKTFAPFFAHLYGVCTCVGYVKVVGQHCTVADTNTLNNRPGEALERRHPFGFTFVF